eukprot:CAMPEP_0181197938 /NCGR_PEP_ID=MMETSP1096-20121128/16325_1 /TAXON_ID=156174 ORGANISM="Chrysochromulina ericina, Strain CCMP281" /NCGR_SAMPLE_ID=MMETSP1096 /ASSEMBLY_ACC=CAM_ASM_000453 /LENGTH=77 /DNA_ID=CAMNT_0023287917 /DNA_START=49 /DNA_END=283 /DNA_ORIENTATION=+
MNNAQTQRKPKMRNGVLEPYCGCRGPVAEPERGGQGLRTKIINQREHARRSEATAKGAAECYVGSAEARDGPLTELR